MFDPRQWADGDEYRIYGDDRGEMFALVDGCFFVQLVAYKWSPKWSKRGKKVYLRRVVQETWGTQEQCPDTGQLLRYRTQRTLFLHHAVLKLAGVEPPSPKHTLVDHRNGDGLDCRKANLRWATPSQNAKNLNGRLAEEEF